MEIRREELYISAFILGFAALVFLVQPVKITVLLGSSMDPTITHGDVVVYSQYADVDTGDIIVFTPEFTNGVLAHRVVNETPDGYITKGDNNDGVDPGVVTSGEIRGTVITVVPVPSNAPIYDNLLPDGYPDWVTRHTP